MGMYLFFVKTICKVERDYEEIFNLVILRGSIPLFWYQDKGTMGMRLKFSREKEVSVSAFKKHFNKIKKNYGKIHVINLLGTGGDEVELSAYYSRFLEDEGISFTNFDFNRYSLNFKSLRSLFYEKLDQVEDKNVVFRVSCLDCLDRTNVVQYLICEYLLRDTLGITEEGLFECLRRVWVENGNVLSNFYSGADSLKSELALKGRRSFGGLFDDFLISAARVINGRFTDKAKNEIIITLLQRGTERNTALIDDNVLNNSDSLAIECEWENAGLLLVLTWCLNHKKHSEDLDFSVNVDEDIAIVAISLQKVFSSYKKFVTEEKKGERERWKSHFNKKLSALGFVLVSQNFTLDIGLMLFARRELSNRIKKIKTRKHRQKTYIFRDNISVSISFLLGGKTYSFTACNLNVSRKEIEIKNSRLDLHFDQIMNGESDYVFIAGNFHTPLFLGESELEERAEAMEYESLILKDCLSNYLERLKGVSEAPVTFLPTSGMDGKSKDPMYSSRILFGGRIKSLEYVDVLFHATSFRPVYGKFHIESSPE
jgi:hypothetical protein